jgi:membrane protease YdiL (CAAX protease family)
VLGLGPAARAANEPSALATFLENYKAFLVIPALVAVLTVVWLFFRNTWRELDEDAHRHRAEILSKGRMDYRPFIAMALVAMILTMQDTYGGRPYFVAVLLPALTAFADKHAWLGVKNYDELWSFGWWSGTRIAGYLFPFLVWKIFFRRDSLLDFGLRTRGFWDHAWIYALFLAVVLPAMLVVSHSPDFGDYYPFYKLCSRSWFDYLVWEAMYFCQFFALEMFFRGFWLGALRRSFGSGAIFSMAVPYCMIHYGKPYLEVCGAIVAGIALASLSMKTKSIYQGFMVHVTVAGLMDWLSLRHRNGTPIHFWPQATGATGMAWIGEERRREILARTIERSAVSLLIVFCFVGMFFVLRNRRRSLERL